MYLSKTLARSDLDEQNEINKYIPLYITLGFLFYLYTDFLAVMSVAIYINYIIFIFFVGIAILDLKKAILLQLGYGILFLEYPRNILSYTSFNNRDSLVYYTLTSQKFGYLTIYHLLLVIITLISISKIIRFETKALNKYFCLLLFFVGIGFFSLAFTYVMNNSFMNLRMAITDFKSNLFLICGFFQGIYLSKKKCLKNLYYFLIQITIIAGFRVLFYIISDILLHQIKLDFSPLSYFALALLITVIVRNNYSIIKHPFVLFAVLLNFINTSRGFYLIFGVILSIIFVVQKSNRRSALNKFILIFVLFIVSVFTFLMINLPDIMKFILWKLNVFEEIFGGKDLSESGQIRIYELLNVIYGNLQNIFWFLFGKGYGGGYTFEYFRPSFLGKLREDSYSLEEISRGIFFTVHNFATIKLLKTGFIGLLLYLYIPINYIKNNIRVNKMRLFFCIFIFVGIIYTYHWRYELACLLGVFLAFTGPHKSEEKSENIIY
jgi:hypothetical protein